MPRTSQFTKEDIASRALQIIRESGPDALSARTLGAALGVSSRPIFTVFKNMDEVIQYTRFSAMALFKDYVGDVRNYFPAFKEFGLRLVRFASEESKIFLFLFMDKDSKTEWVELNAMDCVRELGQLYDLTENQVDILFKQMWVFACGLAFLNAKSPDAYNAEQVGQMLSMQFMSVLSMIKSGKEVENITPRFRGNI